MWLTPPKDSGYSSSKLPTVGTWDSVVLILTNSGSAVDKYTVFLWRALYGVQKLNPYISHTLSGSCNEGTWPVHTTLLGKLSPVIVNIQVTLIHSHSSSLVLSTPQPNNTIATATENYRPYYCVPEVYTKCVETQIPQWLPDTKAL